jgi:hypothetical protein
MSSPEKQDQKQSEILFLELDINQTEKRFRKYAEDYNKELHNPEFLKEQHQAHQKYKVQVQESIKSLSIKNTHIQTTSAIIKAYFNHLKQIEKGKIIKDPIFTMNNEAIGTMTGMCGRSARRHVNKLLATGFLLEKVFRGSNAAFILKINPEFLVARPNKKLTDLLINQHVERYPAMPICPITLKLYKSLKPSFTDFPSGIIRTLCPHVEINPDTFNNNILSKGIVDNCLHTKSKRPQKISVINNDLKNSSCVGNPDNKNPEQTIVRHQESQNQDYQQKIQREKQKNIPPAMLHSIFFFTELAWNFVRSLLYENREFQPGQIQAAKHHIAGYFLEYVRNNNPKTISQCYNEFITTIQIIDDYTKRKVEWQTARPEYFFDPRFSGGFHRAFKEWLPKHKEKQKKNKEWNTNKKLVAQLFRYYSTDPTFERYRKCTQRLGKLKNKKFLDTFNTCILDKDNYNNQFLNQQN